MKLCRQPCEFFQGRSHLQTLMRSERVVQVDGFLCKAPDLLQTFVFCTEEPSVLERIVHPLGQGVVQWVSALCHAYLYSKRFEFVDVLIAAVLHAAVGVVYELREFDIILSVEIDGHREGFHRTLSLKGRMQAPAHDQT